MNQFERALKDLEGVEDTTKRLLKMPDLQASLQDRLRVILDSVREAQKILEDEVDRDDRCVGAAFHFDLIFVWSIGDCVFCHTLSAVLTRRMRGSSRRRQRLLDCRVVIAFFVIPCLTLPFTGTGGVMTLTRLPIFRWQLLPSASRERFSCLTNY